MPSLLEPDGPPRPPLLLLPLLDGPLLAGPLILVFEFGWELPHATL